MIRVTLHRPQGPGATISVEHMRRALTFVEYNTYNDWAGKDTGAKLHAIVFPRKSAKR